MDKKLKAKLFFSFVTLSVLFFVVISKAFLIQIYNRDKLKKYSQSQILRTRTIYPNRGAIYDRDGSPIAINIKTYNIFTIPKNLKNVNATLKEVSKAVPSLKYQYLKTKVKGRNRFTWLKRKYPLTKKESEKLKLIDGIYFERTTKRLYPNNELMSQLVGYVGIDNAGLSGLEYHFNDHLKGDVKRIRYIKDAKGRPVKFENEDLTKKSNDLHLTLDKSIQAVAEKALKDIVQEYEAKGAGIGVMDAESGDLLAIANYPSYNPNSLRVDDRKYRKLSFVTNPFEPGSIMKTITITSALENGIIGKDSNYYCERGRLKVGNHVIKEADTNKTYEWLSVNDILKYSSNIGTTKIAFDLTYPRLKETFDLFKLGEKTGIEIPGESRGIFKHKDNVSPLTLSNLSFGQGIATTALQMLAGYVPFANGGYYVRPRITKDAPVFRERIVSSKHANMVQEMLVEAVEQGTGQRAKMPFFTIAGKTSTAQKSGLDGSYNNYISGFVGFPVNVKKPFVVYVYVDEPKGKNYYGGIVAVPAFKKVVQHLLYKNKEFEKLKLAHEKKEFSFDKINTKSAGVSRYNASGTLPNFIGLDKVSAKNLADELNLKISFKGIGIIKDQFPKPGAAINDDKIIKVELSPPHYD